MPQLIFLYGLLQIHLQNKCKQLTAESPLHDWFTALDEMRLLCVLCALPCVLCGEKKHHKEHKEEHKEHKGNAFRQAQITNHVRGFPLLNAYIYFADGIATNHREI